MVTYINGGKNMQFPQKSNKQITNMVFSVIHLHNIPMKLPGQTNLLKN